jgi:hypothetical protein
VDTTVAEGGADSTRHVLWIGINSEPDIAAGEAVLASQYVAAGKTSIQAQKEVASLNACFGSYETPPENRNRPKEAVVTPPQNTQNPIEK